MPRHSRAAPASYACRLTGNSPNRVMASSVRAYSVLAFCRPRGEHLQEDGSLEIAVYGGVPEGI